MSKINRLPYGFQDFLGNTAAGNNPDKLLTDVRPTVDMSPYWAFGQTQFEGQSKAVGAIGGGAFFTVPAGELWSPIHIGGEFTGYGTGGTFELRTSIFSNNLAVIVPTSNSGLVTNGASTRVNSHGFSFPQKTLYGAGTIFGIYFGYWTTTAITLKAGIEYVKFKA